jgi:hypothetical protein
VRPELHEHIDVAAIGEAIGQHGTEQRQLPNAIAAAQSGDLGFGDRDMGDHHAHSGMMHLEFHGDSRTDL